MKKIFIGAITAIIILLITATTIVYTSRMDKSLENLVKSGTIRIGYAIEAPYAFINDKGEITGESPEVAKYIVKKLGIKRIEWKLTEFGSLISGLEAGQYDVIAAGMFITKDRSKVVSFSEPTFHVKQGLLVQRGNPLKINEYEKIAKLDNVRVAVLLGSIEETMLKKVGVKEDRIEKVPDAETGCDEVELKSVDALALSAISLRWMVLQDKINKAEIVENFVQPQLAISKANGYGAFEFRKSDKKLSTAWNEVLKSFIGSKQHLKLIEKFGFTRDELPGKISTKEVIDK